MLQIDSGFTCWGAPYDADTLVPSLCGSTPWFALAMLEDLGNMALAPLDACGTGVSTLTTNALLAHNAGVAGLPAGVARVLPDELKQAAAAHPDLSANGPTYTEFSGYATAAFCWQTLRSGTDFRELVASVFVDHPWKRAMRCTTEEVAVPSFQFGERFIPALGEGCSRARQGWNPGFGGVITARMLSDLGGMILGALAGRPSPISLRTAEAAMTTVAKASDDEILRGPVGFTPGFLSHLPSEWASERLSSEAVGICAAGGTAFLVIDPCLDLAIGGVFRFGIDERVAHRREAVIKDVLARLDLRIV